MFCKSTVITKTLNAFFPIGIENFNSKAKKSSLVILTKKKSFRHFSQLFGAVKLQSYKIARKSFYYIFDGFSLYREVKLKFFLLPVLKVILMKQL